MGLFLIETKLTEKLEKTDVQTKVEKLEQSLEEANLIEVQVAKDFSRTFFIFETDNEEKVSNLLKEQQFEVDLVKPVRIVGQDLEEAKKKAQNANYLVEWNLPEDLTMEQYLERKKKNSVHYAEVPEVSFERTYVCEDMSKCLCFYDAPDEDAVKRAREAVKTPIDSITEISSK
ncbi:DUF4242 domain-containing protein [Aliibacillus thermotolerans]|uniref:DUF4242 domain-containing protein n=1 Tax=Aliibacillus thermotolerans TaxID=1834418 RepID=A0ABW0U5D8_9BACI|nr:DUF4242 domain-containing protein [Aliibacillus thermotolerans]MDA3129006.1 DUF4242 domain-containing protein [Aliibacillus thermotolerans]